MKNSAFQRALISLSHPVSIGALVILLLNDHWWRQVAPSWFTGKISDFAWLIFAPFLLAALLAIVTPRHWVKRDDLIGRGSILITGLIFTLTKATAFHAITVGVVQALTGGQTALLRDPTDLVVLPALLITWTIWNWSGSRLSQKSYPGWILLSLAAMATIATSPSVADSGINCVVQDEGRLIADQSWMRYPNVYASQDGGLTWQSVPRPDKPLPCSTRLDPITQPSDPSIQYRFNQAGWDVIERSADGGKTWQQEYTISSMPEAESIYIERTRPNADPHGQPNLLDAAIDPHTGNLVLALGHRGVLVRTADGAWHAVGIGPYQEVDLHDVNRVASLLTPELTLALLLFPLLIATLAPVRKSIGYFILLIIPWAAWWGVAIFFPPVKTSGMLQGFIPDATIVIAVVAVPMALIQLGTVFRAKAKVGWLTLGLCLVATALFLLPFVIWSQNGIPLYTVAGTYAVILVAVTSAVGRFYLQNV